MDNISISSNLGQQDLQALMNQINKMDGVSATLTPSADGKAALTMTLTVEGKKPVMVDIRNPEITPPADGETVVKSLNDAVEQIQKLIDSLEPADGGNSVDTDIGPSVDFGFSLTGTILLLQKVAQELRKSLKEIRSQEYKVAAEQNEKEADAIKSAGEISSTIGYVCAGIGTAMTVASAALTIGGGIKQGQAFKTSGYGEAKQNLNTVKAELDVAKAEGNSPATELIDARNLNNAKAGAVARTRGVFEHENAQLKECNAKVQTAKAEVAQAEKELAAAKKDGNQAEIDKAQQKLTDKKELLSEARQNRDEQLGRCRDAADDYISAVKDFKDDANANIKQLEKADKKGNADAIERAKTELKSVLGESSASYKDALGLKLDQCRQTLDGAMGKFINSADTKRGDVLMGYGSVAKALGDSFSGFGRAAGDTKEAAARAQEKQAAAQHERQRMAVDDTDKSVQETRDILQLALDLAKAAAQSHQQTVQQIFG